MRIAKLVLLAALSATAYAQNEVALEAAIQSEHRTERYVERDVYRNPVATLSAFGVTPSSEVLEIWPGGGWYTEILAPYLRDSGRLTVAHFPTETEIPYYMTARMNFEEKLATTPAVYDQVQIATLNPSEGLLDVGDSQFDSVLTFRNVHNWLRGGNEQRMFQEFFRVLKAGGTLGVVEHRTRNDIGRDEMIRSGYMTQSYVIAVAESAGFELVEAFEVNANDADTANHEGGVWALPPTLTNGDENKAHFVAIGESDRMTLLFRKPE